MKDDLFEGRFQTNENLKKTSINRWLGSWVISQKKPDCKKREKKKESEGSRRLGRADSRHRKPSFTGKRITLLDIYQENSRIVGI